MRFCRGWQELLNGVLVDVKRSREDLWFSLKDIGVEIESAEEPLEDGREDSVEGFVLERSEGSKGQMAKDTGCYERATSSRRTHCGYQNGVDDLLEGFFFVLMLVPSTLI